MISQLQLDGLTFGTYASGYLLKRLGGFGMPEAKVDVKDRGNYHGARLGNYAYGRRALSLEGEIIGDDTTDYESKRRALSQACDLMDGLKTLTITTRAGLVITADVIVSAALEEPYKAGDMIRGDFRLEFVAPFPFFLSQSEHSQNIDPFVGGGGTIPAAIPFSLAVGGTGAETVANAGNGDAFPTVTIYGTIENPSLLNETTGESLALTYTLATSTDYIVIDFYNRTVLLNGITNISQYVSGDWWRLKPGNNSIKLASASYSADAHAVLEWFDTYVGL